MSKFEFENRRGQVSGLGLGSSTDLANCGDVSEVLHPESKTPVVVPEIPMVYRGGTVSVPASEVIRQWP